MLNNLSFNTIKTVVLKVIVFILSYISPLIGLLILWMGNKKNNLTYKVPAIAGSVIAVVLFFADYIAFILK